MPPTHRQTNSFKALKKRYHTKNKTRTYHKCRRCVQTVGTRPV